MYGSAVNGLSLHGSSDLDLSLLILNDDSYLRDTQKQMYLFRDIEK